MVSNNLKVYVPVDVEFREDGTMLPRIIVWEDGTKYEIDRVTDIRQAAAIMAGGQGDRAMRMHSGCFTGHRTKKLRRSEK